MIQFKGAFEQKKSTEPDELRQMIWKVLDEYSFLSIWETFAFTCDLTVQQQTDWQQ